MEVNTQKIIQMFLFSPVKLWQFTRSYVWVDSQSRAVSFMNAVVESLGLILHFITQKVVQYGCIFTRQIYFFSPKRLKKIKLTRKNT